MIYVIGIIIVFFLLRLLCKSCDPATALWLRRLSGILLIAGIALTAVNRIAGVIVLAIALFCLLSLRNDSAPAKDSPKDSRKTRQKPSITNEVEEAAAILGVPVGAEPKEIEAAWDRMIRRTHPDAGGTDYLAAQTNKAREILLAYHSKANR